MVTEVIIGHTPSGLVHTLCGATRVVVQGTRVFPGPLPSHVADLILINCGCFGQAWNWSVVTFSVVSGFVLPGAARCVGSVRPGYRAKVMTLPSLKTSTEMTNVSWYRCNWLACTKTRCKAPRCPIACRYSSTPVPIIATVIERSDSIDLSEGEHLCPNLVIASCSNSNTDYTKYSNLEVAVNVLHCCTSILFGTAIFPFH